MKALRRMTRCSPLAWKMFAHQLMLTEMVTSGADENFSSLKISFKYFMQMSKMLFFLFDGSLAQLHLNVILPFSNHLDARHDMSFRMCQTVFSKPHFFCFSKEEFVKNALKNKFIARLLKYEN